MFSALAAQSDRIFAIMRILVGINLTTHGTQKLFGWFGGLPEGVPAFITYVAGPIELVGGVLIVVGLFSRPAAFVCSGLMAAAYFMGHVAPGGFWPILNQGEVAIAYCWIFLYLAARGPGTWSIDGARAGGAEAYLQLDRAPSSTRP